MRSADPDNSSGDGVGRKRFRPLGDVANKCLGGAWNYATPSKKIRKVALIGAACIVSERSGNVPAYRLQGLAWCATDD
jgi:hypothetical protein